MNTNIEWISIKEREPIFQQPVLVAAILKKEVRIDNKPATEDETVIESASLFSCLDSLTGRVCNWTYNSRPHDMLNFIPTHWAELPKFP